MCIIQDIKEDKKNKLKNNIIILEKLNEKLKESTNELNTLFNKIDKDKENLKLSMQKIFTKIRNSINERENELLDEIDDIFNKKFIDENLMKEGEKLPNKIKLTLERVKSMNIELNDNNLNKYINDCIIIENDIEKINLINEQIDKSIQNDTSKIKFYPEENEKNDIYEKIKSFGKINIFNNNYY